MMHHENGSASERNNGRNPLFIIVGFVLLGVALALALFGGTLFDRSANDGEASILSQIPALSDVAGETAVLPRGAGPLSVGDIAYDFVLQDLDGNPHQLSTLRGQPVIINFWATWCAPCRVEMPELQAAYEKYRDDELVILALDQNEPPDVVRAFFYDEMGLTFTPLLDNGTEVSQLYGVFNFPSTFFIDPAGTITAIHRGPMVQSQIEGYLAEMLAAEG